MLYNKEQVQKMIDKAVDKSVRIIKKEISDELWSITENKLPDEENIGMVRVLADKLGG